MSLRRSTRSRNGHNMVVSVDEEEKKEEMVKKEEEVEEDEYEALPSQSFYFEGVRYGSYQEMVMAKRQRNEKMMIDSGLLDAASSFKKSKKNKALSSAMKQEEGLQSNKRKSNDSAVKTSRRTSKRLAGIDAKDIHISYIKNGKPIVGGIHNDNAKLDHEDQTNALKKEEITYYGNRVNDGSPLALEDAVNNIGSKWIKEDSFTKAQNLFTYLTHNNPTDKNIIQTPSSKPSLTETEEQEQEETVREKDLNLDSVEVRTVAKVVPERIYSVCFHPQEERLIACAGDKVGNVGIWNVTNMDNNDTQSNHNTSTNNNKQEVVLIKPHNGVVTHLEWNKNNQLLSVSYDSTLRLWDAQKQHFQQIFATYDDDSNYKNHPGYNLDNEKWFYIQYGCFANINNNNNGNDSILFSSSRGTVGHLDLRSPNHRATSNNALSFYEHLSEKKINSVSLHPNGHLLATAGLDYTVQLWDLRKFQPHNNKTKNKMPKSLSKHFVGRSINSAFFSPNGQQLLTTTMGDALQLYNTTDMLTSTNQSNGANWKPYKSIRHNNQTGRWLSTFMARWHPTVDDIFVVGSLLRPRMMEIYYNNKNTINAINPSAHTVFKVTGENMTAVASRCCFHPSTSTLPLTLMGGNSSGRVVIAR